VAAQREAARQQSREERRKAALAQKKKDDRIALLKRWGRMAGVAGAVTLVALLIFRQTPEVENVQKVDEIRAVELVPGTSFDYGTSTPTSGQYYKDAQAGGVFDEQISAEQAATSIYYGAVVLWYSPDLPAAELASLLTTASEYDTHVAVSPQEGLSSPIIATAWNRLMEYETAEGVDEFLDIYRKRSPGSDDCPVEA
jgi:hypothetical protein